MYDSITLNGICPIYKKALDEMSSALNYTRGKKKKLQILLDFSKKYLMFPEYWKILLTLNYEIKQSAASRAFLIAKANSHFYFKTDASPQGLEYHIKWNGLKIPNKMYYGHPFVNDECMKRFLSFPHQNLTKIYDIFDHHSTKPLSFEIKKMFKNSLKLYKKFEKADEDDEKWLNCLKKLTKNNHDAIIANIEFRLQSKPSVTNKNIWKNYIEYLRHQNCILMLKVYQRYSRFFISDTKMREEYRKEIERIGNQKNEAVSNFWVDTIEFEADFGIIETANLLLEKAVAAVLKKNVKFVLKTKEEFLEVLNYYKLEMYKVEGIEEDGVKNYTVSKIRKTRPQKRKKCGGSPIRIPKPSCYLKKSISKPIFQVTPFPSTFIKLLIKNAAVAYSNSALFKLQKSCKYFYSLSKFPNCHRLVIHQNSELQYFEQSLFCNTIHFAGLQNLHITNSLLFESQDRNDLSRLIQKLHKCDAQYIQICNQYIKENEFIFLVSSGRVKYLNLINTLVFNESGMLLEKSELETIVKKYKNNVQWVTVK